MVDQALVRAAAQLDPPAVRLDISRVVAVTGRSSAAVHRALAGKAPRILEEIRRALGVTSTHPVSAR